MRHVSCSATAVTNDGEVTIRNTTRRRGVGVVEMLVVVPQRSQLMGRLRFNSTTGRAR